MSIELKDKLYTSTQVAEVLGVSLRTLYRYMEDNRIGSMRTASGRHRFTKDQIMDFLNGGVMNSDDTASQDKPFSSSRPVDDYRQIYTNTNPVHVSRDNDFMESPVVNVPAFDELPKENTYKSRLERFLDEESLESEDEVNTGQTQQASDRDGLSSRVVRRFGDIETASDDKYKDLLNDDIDYKINSDVDLDEDNDLITDESVFTPEPVVEESVDMGTDLNIRYYKSDNSDLIKLAKRISELADARDLEYAFSGYAGLSLHFLIKPFTILHFYANPEDLQIWKQELALVPTAKREDANIGLIVNTDIVFVPTKEMSGFRVVEDKVLLRDLSDIKESDLVKDFRHHLASMAS